MKKLLILSLTSTLLLGACGFNDDTNNTQDSNKNIKKSKQNKTNGNDKNQSRDPKKQSKINQSNSGSKITPEQAKKNVLEENDNGALTNLRYNSKKSNNDKIFIDFVGPGAVDRIPMQAIVDAHSGEVLSKYTNETKNQKIVRAKNHLQNSIIINKLQDPLIEKYQPQAYNKLKKYERNHPNAFSEKDGHANQKLVNKILGYGSHDNTGEDKENYTNEKSKSNSNTGN